MTDHKPLPSRALARALHGTKPGRMGRSAPRAPDDWELVVAAVELALLGPRLETPPAHLSALARSLAPPEPDPGIVTFS